MKFIDNRRKIPFINILIPILIILAGIIGMKMLEKMKKKPAEINIPPISIPVKAWKVTVTNYPIYLTAFGVVNTLHESRIAPEISGTVIKTSPRLLPGEVFTKGEILFELDSHDYEAFKLSAEASVEQLKNRVKLLTMQLQLNQKRLPIIQRICDLAEKEFTRTSTLYNENKVGTQTSVELSEQKYQQTSDQYAILKNQTELIPLQISETKASLKAAESQLDRAQLNLNRCIVKAPFTGHIKSANVNIGDVLSPAKPVLTIADDSVLEITTPIDSINARKVLQFTTDNTFSANWFGKPNQVSCEIRWTEAPDNQVWTGRVERIEKISPDTRTINIAIRITAKQAHCVSPGQLPLAEGMFCSIKIPGKTLLNVTRLPYEAVTLNSHIYMDIKGKLKSVPIHVVWFDKTFAYVTGLKNEDIVIVTRLISPVDNTLLTTSIIQPENMPL